MSEVKTNKISSLASNNDITIDPDGTGDTIIASGNLGIGTASPSSFYSLANNLVVGTGSGGNGMTIYSGSGDSGYIGFNDTASASMQGFIQYNHNGDYMAFAPNGSEKMRIDSSGNVRINTTGALVSGTEKVTIAGGSSSVYDACLTLKSGYATGSTSVNGVYFLNNSNNPAGYIAWNGTTTSYVTSSDYRLKENVSATWDATTRLKQLNPVRFNFIADADTTVDGFLAHEVQNVVPEAISGTKDAVDDEGNPVYQGIDQSKLVPLLVKTIQELEARITALEAS